MIVSGSSQGKSVGTTEDASSRRILEVNEGYPLRMGEEGAIPSTAGVDRVAARGLDVQAGETLTNVRGCLPVADLVDWACVDVEDAPPGPWLRLATTSAMQLGGPRAVPRRRASPRGRDVGGRS
ncbi:hypothetical protein GCM10027427_20400 [Pseudoclavibacter terrae]